MKLNYALHLCYLVCLGMVLSVQPMKVSQAATNEQVKSCMKMQPVAEPASEVLHGELLFK